MNIYEESCNIDKIMELIRWDRTESEQQAGIAMARNVSCLKAFCQPKGPGYGKNVWDNCALILCERADEELECVILDMFYWLEDLNWPGAERIQERLIQFQKVDLLSILLDSFVQKLVKLEKWAWLSFLADVLKNPKIKSQLKPDTIRILSQWCPSVTNRPL